MPEEAHPTSDGVGENLVIAHPGLFHHRLVGQLLQHNMGLTTPASILGRTFQEDLDLFKQGILDRHSLEAGHTPQAHPVVFEIRSHGGETKPDEVDDDAWHKAGDLKQIVYSHNQRQNIGAKWEAIALGGDVNANLGYVNSSGAVAYTATTVTPTASPTWTVNQWVGHKVIAPTTTGTAPTFVYGVILSNTATALTIDQWTVFGSATGAAGATPAANCSFAIDMGQAPCFWLGLTADTSAFDATTTALVSEITGTGTLAGPASQALRIKAVYSVSAYNSSTSPGTQTFNLASPTLTAAAAVTVHRSALYFTQNGATAAFLANLPSDAIMAISDTLVVTWALTS